MAHIDETTARNAWNGIHFADYRPGQATDEWRQMCKQAREAADDALARVPDRADEIEKIYERYANRAASYINERNRIDAMCPSVLITGAGNFPTRKKQQQNDRLDAFYKKDWGFDAIIRKLRQIGTEREAIKSSDDDAIEKLRAKLTKCEERQEHMKAVNAAIRLKDTKKGDARMRTLGYDDDQIATFRTGAGDFCNRPGFPPYMLQNNSAEIRRIKKRIESIEATKGLGNDERAATINDEPCTVVQNADEMRLQVIFDGKPDGDTRQMLKRAGFRWAPSQGAWQRRLTNNARYALKRIATFEPAAPAPTDDEAESKPTDEHDDNDATEITPETTDDTDATEANDDNKKDDGDRIERDFTLDDWMQLVYAPGNQMTLDVFANYSEVTTAA